jgi:hypothetical protein
MKTNLFIKFYIIVLIFLVKNSFAGEILGISTPYLPNTISLIDSDDLVSNIILTNTSTYLNYTSKNYSNLFKPRKIIRNEVGLKTIWDIEYNENQSLNLLEKLNFNKIKSSINYFQKNEFTKTFLTQELSNTLTNIENITFFQTTDGFTSRFTLKSKDANFLTSLSQIPILNTENAEVLSNEITKGTNLPIYGKFLIAESIPDSHFLLIKNYNYGLGSDPNSVEKINIKKYPDSESRMRAIRSGSIAIIVAPTIKEIKDAETDPTLEIIESPFSKKPLKIIKNSENNESYDLTHLIVRKSLKPDDNFTNFFELHGLSKSVL